MNIAILLNNLSGGGGERVTVSLANGLAEKGHKVRLLVIKPTGPCLELVSASVELVVLKGGRAVKCFPSLLSELKSFKPDALVTSMVMSNVLGALAGFFLSSLPIIAIEHGNMNEAFHTDKAELTANIAYKLAPYIYGRLDVIGCVDASTLLSVAAFTRRKNLNLIEVPNAVIGSDITKRISEGPKHKFFEEGVPVFINIGRMVDQKNQSLLVEAFAIFAQTCEARLIILGDGELRGDLEAQIDRLNIRHLIDMPGFLEPYYFLSNADCFILTSKWEALPTVIIESLYCMCPVLVTKASYGTLELMGFGKYGQIIENENPHCVAEHMSSVLKERYDGKAMRESVQKYATSDVAKYYLDLITSAQIRRSNAAT